MHRFFIVSIFLLIICESCIKIFDFPEKEEYKKIPVIEAIFTDKSDHQKIRLSYTVQFGDSLSAEPITDAQVNIVDETGDTVMFHYSKNGWYTSNDMIAWPEIRYTLLVQIDTTVYHATSIMMPGHGIDSLTYSHDKKKGIEDSAYYVKVYAGITDQDNPKYSQIKAYKNHKSIMNVVLSDIATFSLNGIDINYSFAKGDTLDIEMYSISREMYDYYIYINEILYNNSKDLDYKTNPTIQFTPTAEGYFQISSLSCKSVIMN